MVQEYIRNFSQPGDVVLDPFGGTGVTAIESMMLGRKAIYLDINPLAVFMVKSLTMPVDIEKLKQSITMVLNEFEKVAPSTDKEIEDALKKYPYPKGISLFKSSSVSEVEELFTSKQLADLAVLKHLIMQQTNESIRHSLLLTFSSAMNKTNLTFHRAPSRPKGGGDGSSIFRYYSYKIFDDFVNVNVRDAFRDKFNYLLPAKEEIQFKINDVTWPDSIMKKGNATDLDSIKNESVDYIYTDPPYGAKIPYLDLSVMWNAWLEFDVSEEDYEAEAIQGGSLKKTKDDYKERIRLSIREMYRVLKFDRWMSFVFAHKDPSLWHLIIDAAEEIGFEYMGAVKQSNGSASLKKVLNPHTVLAGQLIINFRKIKRPRTLLKARLGMNVESAIMETIESTIAQYEGATIEQINDHLILKGLELGFLHLLRKEYSDITPLLQDNFDYNKEKEKFFIRKNTSFKTQIDVRVRIRYFVLSYLRSLELREEYPDFDDIVLNIMPLLKNGNTPEDQTILSIFERYS